MFNSFQGGIHMVSTILRLPKVIERTGISRSLIYLKIGEGKFPKPIKLGERAIGWPASAIDAWIEEQIQKAAAEQGG